MVYSGYALGRWLHNLGTRKCSISIKGCRTLDTNKFYKIDNLMKLDLVRKTALSSIALKYIFNIFKYDYKLSTS